MKRADWQKVKTESTKYNNGKPVKFSKDMKFGDALDAFNAAVKKRESTDIGKDKKAWAIAAQAWLDTREKVMFAAATYDKDLDKIQANDQAKKVLKQAIFNFLKNLSSGPGAKQAETLKVGIAKVKKELAAAK